MTKKCHNRRLQTNQRYCEEETQNILGLDCILLYIKSKISNSFFKDCKHNINQSIYQNRSSMVYTQMYLMFCGSTLNRFSCMLNTFNFHCWQLHLKTNNNNVSSVTIAIFSSFIKHDSFISYYNAYIILYSNFERNYFVC